LNMSFHTILATTASIGGLQGALLLNDLVIGDLLSRRQISWRSQNRDPHQGTRWIRYLRQNTSGNHMFWSCRMNQHQFDRLLSALVSRFGLTDGRIVSAAEKLGMTLYILAHGVVFRAVAVMLGRAVSTCHRSFTECLEALRRLMMNQLDRPIDDSSMGMRRDDSRLYNIFRHAVGALDGVLIYSYPPECVPNREQYRCRKGFMAMNCLACVNWDGDIVYLATGAPGACNDSGILNSLASDLMSKTPRGSYWLADAGYGIANGLTLTPHRGTGVLYHLPDFRPNGVRRTPRTAAEGYNYIHSSCRVIVECVFGIMKKRWSILNKPLKCRYYWDRQQAIIQACTALHNFINGSRSREDRARVRRDISPPYEEDLDWLRNNENADRRRERLSSYIWTSFSQHSSLQDIATRGMAEMLLQEAQLSDMLGIEERVTRGELI
jgi:hypothetical protein